MTNRFVHPRLWYYIARNSLWQKISNQFLKLSFWFSKFTVSITQFTKIKAVIKRFWSTFLCQIKYRIWQEYKYFWNTFWAQGNYCETNRLSCLNCCEKVFTWFKYDLHFSFFRQNHLFIILNCQNDKRRGFRDWNLYNHCSTLFIRLE